ncbi:MAG: exodeoxyribonuclease VII small subunit, partial [Dermatophilaceae bacterium]|nr:exodeoxyribonuclease VII small subunit [Dermatophilaceae bacterium]
EIERATRPAPAPGAATPPVHADDAVFDDDDA